MSRITTKILKMIIFLGIFAWYVYSQFQKGGAIFSLEIIGAGLGPVSYTHLSAVSQLLVVTNIGRFMLVLVIVYIRPC